MRRRLVIPIVVIAALATVAFTAAPYARAASLIVRVAGVGGTAERLASLRDRRVDRRPRHMVPTRHGDVPAQFYIPDAINARPVLVMPGFNSNGIDEPRLARLAQEIAASGIPVMALALPDLQHFKLSPDATDVIEDAVAWMATQPGLAPDGRIGIVGVSFSGGLAISAAGRDRIRDHVAYIVSLGGHGDLRRVMRYLATGEERHVEGVEIHRPHDYGVGVILNCLADRGVVPIEQAPALSRAIDTFLRASQLTVTSQAKAAPVFAEARAMAETLPEPSRTYMHYVNDRDVKKLGAVLVPYLNQLGADDPALSPELAPPPAAPTFLLHGHEDNIVPAAESVLLADHLRSRGVPTRLLLTDLITHASINPGADASEAWNLIRFWTDVLSH